jgi:hypothetical protein
MGPCDVKIQNLRVKARAYQFAFSLKQNKSFRRIIDIVAQNEIYARAGR